MVLRINTARARRISAQIHCRYRTQKMIVSASVSIKELAPLTRVVIRILVSANVIRALMKIAPFQKKLKRSTIASANVQLKMEPPAPIL